MNDSIYIPKKIRVGYQKNEGTYSGFLAYVIYYDDKGKLRKETSFNSWRDKKITPTEFDNTPVEGFVLNKKVGGYSTGWNHRQTYTRVYDPRGFEFEITIPNLLYILENASCIKGKGLEGKFTYGWDGTELLLIPEAAPEFSKIAEFSDTMNNKEKFSSKTLIPGATYLTNKNETTVYLGRFECFRKDWRDNGSSYYKSSGKNYVFHDPEADKTYRYYSPTSNRSNLSHLVKLVNPEPVEDFAELIENLETWETMYPPDESKFKKIKAKPVQGAKYFSYKGSDYSLTVTTYGGLRVKYLDTHPSRNNGWCYSYKSKDLKDLEQIIYKGSYSEVVYTKEELVDLINKFQMTQLERYLTNGKKAKQYE